ncbi:MAG: hypothetical protein R3B40_26860 [Polyangiales bacterium]|nr:hypothetical protein [Myxococcales bacterium]MCB9660220.1 hypothetical protein [Sandaracinaceae bacterium]
MVFLCGLAGCQHAGGPGREAPVVQLDTRRTTNPDVAVNNLHAAIDSLRARLALTPDDTTLSAALADQLLARAAYLGSYDDFREVDELTARAYAHSETTPSVIMQRAGYLSAVHRFVEASELIDLAERHGAEAGEVERARIVIGVATGTAPALLLPRAEALVAESDTYARLTVLGTVQAAGGHYDEADATYLRALERYRDVSPFALAWVSFTRGVMWGEAAGRPDIARVLYRDAVARLPQYVVANVHLSELEDSAAAIPRLEGIAYVAGDPEPAGRLAQRLEDSDPDRAADLRQRGTERYDELLARHREAFLDHGAEFFAGVGGDPQRALALALENVALRPVPRAYVVAIGAALEADALDTACALVAQSARWRGQHVVLEERAAELSRRCP